MTVATWATETVAAGERFAFWGEAVCDGVLKVEPERIGTAPFNARLTARRYDDLGFITFSSSPHRIHRRARHIGRYPDAPFLLSLQLQGQSVYDGKDGPVTIRRGDLALVDSARPFTVRFPDTVARAIAVLPRRMVLSRAPWLECSPAVRIPHEAAFTRLAWQYFLADAFDGSAVGRNETVLLAENLCNLTALATAPSRNPPMRRARAHDRLEALIGYMSRHVSDPALSPGIAAAALGISTRSVHALMAQSGTSFTRWLRERRLNAARDALASREWADRSTAEIAYAIGFGDVSHFSRLFKQRFGVSPGAWRRNSSDS